MHICLLPTEILLHIFVIYKNSYRPCATLAALAATCRKFKEPALDTLWKDITGFRPLISCLLSGITRKRRGKSVLRRPFSDGEWRLINQYARRIRSFTVSDVELDVLGNQFMQALLSAPLSTPLLPNLRSLVWDDTRERFHPLLRALLGPTITFLELGNISSPSSLALLAFLGAQCPSLRELTCNLNLYDYNTEGRLDASCEALHNLRGLSRLNAGYLTPRELLRLASLSSLKSLSFVLEDYNYEEEHYPTPIVFSKLDQVHITAEISPLNSCLANVRFLSCRSVTIDCSDFDYTKILYDPLDIPGLIVSLSKCFPPPLEQLRLHWEFDFFTFTDECILADPSFVFGFDVVAPLLSFSHLTDLRLDWICISAIDDASLKTIAQSWPRLETFWFGNAARWVIPPSLTFIGLVYLIHHCRHLHTLRMSFCACQVDINGEPFAQTIPNKNITELSVGMSPIVGPIAVASQLHRFLPKLTYVDFLDWLDCDIPTPPPFEHLEEGWDRVNELLKV